MGQAVIHDDEQTNDAADIFHEALFQCRKQGIPLNKQMKAMWGEMQHHFDHLDWSLAEEKTNHAQEEKA